ncbi:uncharacterized protein BDR25DRAFT_302757 [Lindgomyces ingoldianus]|uniref:Uncharacterized protein n=1 Tax=Lindgomyces ingoldianus TaxID=673940 RepID=A0ACB6QY26_9PLEO|nr:uncharacterized protein BDR25DRAFT_302757 [Lindgomyces ingoldianus]KAF2471918.1 hypothetical protein BDR25DRAFT_302757 [Lindgomyces ingoldianus]
MCQLCDYILQQPTYQRRFLATSTFKAPSLRRQLPRHHGVFPTISARRSTTASRATLQAQELEPERPEITKAESKSLSARLQKVERFISSILESPKIEEGDQKAVFALGELQSIAEIAIDIRLRQLQKGRKLNSKASSAAALLSLENGNSTGNLNGKSVKISTSPLPNDLPSPTHLQQLAETLLRNEKVFVSPALLSEYVDLVRILQRPRSLPAIFRLYANKPIPIAGTCPPRFSKPSPNAAKQAVPKEIAERALSAAIASKDLVLALDVVDTTFCAPAWTRHKIVTKAIPPTALAAFLPLVLWVVAQEMSFYSGYIDPWSFKMYSWAGLLTYVSCTGTLGFVAFTTANDHFDRVVWRPGMPLRDRWLREEERAALDRIAGAWGFKETWRRGDEEGEEWEGLREFISLRGMWLDKPDLLEGMNPGGEFGKWKMSQSLFSRWTKKT